MNWKSVSRNISGDFSTELDITKGATCFPGSLGVTTPWGTGSTHDVGTKIPHAAKKKKKRKDNSKRKKKFAKRIFSSIARLTGIEVVTWFLYERKKMNI